MGIDDNGETMKHDLPSVPCCSFWESNRLNAARGVVVVCVDDFVDVDDTNI